MTSPNNSDFDDPSSLLAPDPTFIDRATPEKWLRVVALLLQASLLATGISWLSLLVAEVTLASFEEAGTPAWNTAYDSTQLAHISTILFSGTTLLLLICWTTWAYQKLDSIGKASENPKLVLLSWFIPIVNLLIPGRVLEELSLHNRNEKFSKTQRLVWYFWLAGPVTFWVRQVLLRVEPLLFTFGLWSTAFTGLKWATILLITTASFAGIAFIRTATSSTDSQQDSS